MTTVPLLHSVPEAAAQLSVTQRTVERLIAAGEIATVKIGRRRLVPHASLEAYIDHLKKVS